ncbi:MAG: Bax inhibitor-1/YccA family protein [Actinobacteria bacterium]|nr:Bax inhibitor-1/YccA family protein [Actinomycetota bacterium]
MQTANPVLARIDRDAAQASRSGSGFAYEEGRSAVASAQHGEAPPAPAPAADDAGIYSGVQIPAPPGQRVTYPDVMAKSAIMFGIAVVMAFAGWIVTEAMPGIGTVLVFGALIATLVLGFVNALKRQVSPPLTMLYAVVSGFMLGAVSYWYNQIALQSDYEGLVLQAVLATFTTFGVMLLLYGTGIVKVTNKFMKFMLVAMVSYFFIAVASFVAAMFGVGGGWGFYGVGTLGLLLCIFGVGLAAFSLMLDFEAIKQGVAMGLPERESWRMSFGLLVTLVWLYLEFLRLFAIIASGRD